MDGNVKNWSNLPMHFKPVLSQSCLTLKQILPEAELKYSFMILECTVRICKTPLSQGFAKAISYRDPLSWNIVESLLLVLYFTYSSMASMCSKSLGKSWCLRILTGLQNTDETGKWFIRCLILNDATWRNYEAVLNMMK